MLNQKVAQEKRVGGSHAMKKVTLYHNPGWGNSRGALELLRAQGVEFDIVEYLKTPLHRTALERIVTMLDTPPAELVRKDRRFEALQLKPADYVSAEEVVTLLLKYPELLQRPIVVKGSKAVIARPPERMLPLLGLVR
jgi:arsenate reductase (glutaredoxin)